MTDEFRQSALFARDVKEEGPVECLGLTFESDTARRAYFSDVLRQRLQDPDFRNVPGFPIGSDEDILAMSDPPYHTACPNPFLTDFLRCYGKAYDPQQSYERKPFAVDSSEGKTDPMYKAHSYHTKIPHLAIVPFILHYTEPGDVILDGFCGSGMTGLAARWCSSAPESYRQLLEVSWRQADLGKPRWGPRHAILNDLSPAATFIAANYSLPWDVEEFAAAGKRLLAEVEAELGWMYETRHTDGNTRGRIEYTVWSEVFSCPDCSGEVVFFDEALDAESKRVRDSFPCPHCGSQLTKQRLLRQYENRLDPTINSVIKVPKRKPVLINYVVGGKRFEKAPDTKDLELLEQIAAMELPPDIPTNLIPPMHMTHERARMDYQGVTHVHHFFLPRAAHALGALWRKANGHPDPRTRHMLLFFVEQAVWGMSLLNRYQPIQHGRIGGSQVNRQLTGIYYIASQHSEVSPWYNLGNKLEGLVRAFRSATTSPAASIIATGNTARLDLPDNCVDYIFTDPPFGENIYYADLNFLVESWHRVLTDAAPEAIVDKHKHKELPEYQRLMQRCFEEYHRVLKPGRWMTVVFHNSRNAVWNSIQEALLAAGFVVADVRTMDKQQGSYRQVTSTAVKQDMVISAYKPNGGLEERFGLEAGTEKGVWDFIRTHLKQLPVFVSRSGRAEIVLERKNHLLYDRMVAFHVQHGKTIPLSSPDFFQGLTQRYPERDDMYFLPEQAVEYDRKRLTVQEVSQLAFFVSDEFSAIQWLKQLLLQKPLTFQEIHPQFLREIGGWQKYEKPMELSELLAQNFLCYDHQGEVPSQVHSYLSTNFKDLRSLAKDHPALQAKAKGRWYVPDPYKAGDLEKIRERSLLREFQGYRDAAQRRLKVFRLEAVRAGFKKAWGERDYAVIIEVARKIPEDILQEDPKLLMWYDQALMRTENG
ncbi:MAG: DNA methyltransferase [Thermaerobacter sp.]|nr:DNA methyltransferase [Thermaerobacter sp.]